MIYSCIQYSYATATYSIDFTDFFKEVNSKIFYSLKQVKLFMKFKEISKFASCRQLNTICLTLELVCWSNTGFLSYSLLTMKVSNLVPWNPNLMKLWESRFSYTKFGYSWNVDNVKLHHLTGHYIGMLK